MESVHRPAGPDDVLAWPACFLVMAALGEDRGIQVRVLRDLLGLDVDSMERTLDVLHGAHLIRRDLRRPDRDNERVTATEEGRRRFRRQELALRRAAVGA
ncbi:MAG: hypothetical protein LWW86_02315 [Micrococcales bacterium]|nr:hypothetical protein [Micrococcales bacterium]